MTEETKPQDSKETTSGDTKSNKTTFVLGLSTAIVAVALIGVISAIWFSFNKDSQEVGLLSGVASESGKVLGTSTEDPDYLVGLAKSLKDAGFVLYSSENDTISQRQAEIFSQAYAGLDHVECNPKAQGSNVDECLAKGIEKYPTWVNGDKKYPGYKTLSELESLLVTK